MRSRRRGTQLWWGTAPWLLMALLAPAAACGNGDGSTDGASVPVEAAAYSVVIEEFLPPVPGDGARPVVFVVRLNDEQFALEDQVTMIGAVEERYDLRFVDDVEAAVADDEDSTTATRDGGLLLGIGSISTTVPHVVRVEVYTGLGLIDAHRLTLSVGGDVWRVEMSEPIEPEVLVGDE